MQPTPPTLRILLGTCQSATISCLVTHQLVRTLVLTPDSPTVDIRCADGTEVAVMADEPLRYEGWFFDRGSILVRSVDHGVIKLCTEEDPVTREDGTVVRIAQSLAYEYRGFTAGEQASSLRVYE